MDEACWIKCIYENEKPGEGTGKPSPGSLSAELKFNMNNYSSSIRASTSSGRVAQLVAMRMTT